MDKSAANLIRSGKVGVLPTDTLYGLVANALLPDSVERIYRLKKRSPQKPLIILISSLKDLQLFNIHLSKPEIDLLEKIWPNPVSVVLSAPDDQFKYLHRGTNTLAFRVPDNEKLRDFLQKTGPLAAPSANPEGKSPAQSIEEARQYFDKEVDFYVDGGQLTSSPSTLISIIDKKITVLRQGAYRLPSSYIIATPI